MGAQNVAVISTLPSRGLFEQAHKPTNVFSFIAVCNPACENGGVCQGGTCDCAPTSFTGPTCADG